jgi:hypothetical protein
MKYEDIINSYIKICDEKFKLDNRWLFEKNSLKFNIVYLSILIKVKGETTFNLERKAEIIYRKLIQRNNLKELKRLKVTEKVLKELE